MKSLRLCVLLLGVAAAQCWAGSVLYWEDLDLGTSAVPGGIALAGDTAVMATSQADFNTKLAAGGWTAVVFGEQDGTEFAGSQTQLTAWVAGGGHLIADTWLSGGLATFMDASVASTNGNTITTAANPIFAGLPATISLTNPGTGWGIFSQGYSTLTGGICLGTLSSGGCAVVEGNGGLTYLNGPLNDTYATLAQGQRLIANELAPTTTPEPNSAVLFGLGIAAAAAFRRLRK